jgi:hypothetical protein
VASLGGGEFAERGKGENVGNKRAAVRAAFAWENL